ncbi:unnamed protein product [Protopolystoma xenopodis]|uniref:Uncharacterized protein n=1 Tax=Protopolystoma xenopodis TaxID=117903 RepID=A0A448WG94_9PLAT|nr:unnamed protein product [Protopolystoma xenopodis]
MSKFWRENAAWPSHPRMHSWPSIDAEWRRRTKLAFLPFYLANRSRLGWAWQDVFVRCEYEASECDLEPIAAELSTQGGKTPSLSYGSGLHVHQAWGRMDDALRKREQEQTRTRRQIA